MTKLSRISASRSLRCWMILACSMAISLGSAFRSLMDLGFLRIPFGGCLDAEAMMNEDYDLEKRMCNTDPNSTRTWSSERSRNGPATSASFCFTSGNPLKEGRLPEERLELIG